MTIEKKGSRSLISFLRDSKSCFIGFFLLILISGLFNHIHAAESVVFASISDALYAILEGFLNVLLAIVLSPFIVFSLMANAFNYIGLNTSSPFIVIPYAILTLCLLYKITGHGTECLSQMAKNFFCTISLFLFLALFVFVLSLFVFLEPISSMIENSDSGMYFYIYDLFYYIATVPDNVAQDEIMIRMSIYLHEDSETLIEKYGNHPYFDLIYYYTNNMIFYVTNVIQILFILVLYYVHEPSDAHKV